MIETDTWSLQEVWSDVLVELAKRYPERCLPEAFALSAFSQSDSFRSIGGHALSAVVEAQKGENCEEILRKIYSMMQDPSSLVRKHMCKALYILLRVLPKKQLESQLLPEALKLVEDDCNEVLNCSLPFFCDLMDRCGYHCKEETIEALRTSFFTSQYSRLSQIKLKYIGRLMVSLRLAMDEEFRNACVDWFCAFHQCKEPEIAVSLAYNFPALLYIVGSLNDLLFELFTALIRDQTWDVQRIVARQIGDVCKISNGRRNELLEIAKEFCNNEKTLDLVLGQLFTVAQALKSYECFLDLLVKLLANCGNWRRTVMILKELIKFCGYFDCSQAFDKVIGILMRYLKQEAFPVRDQSARLLAEIFYKNLRKKEELSTAIIAQLGKSPVCHHRISYILFCEYISKICSHRLFCRIFIPSLLVLAKDPVIDVAYQFAERCVAFRVSLPFSESEFQREFRGILNYYLETGDKVLAKYSIDCDEKIDMIYSEHYNSAMEAKENIKITEENSYEIREIQESKPVVRTKGNRKATIAPRGTSHNPLKRHSLGEIDRAELNKVVQKANNRKRAK